MKIYLKLLKEFASKELYIRIVRLIDEDLEKVLQQAVVNTGTIVIVDGIIGKRTVNAILSLNQDELLKNINKLDSLHIDTLEKDEKELILNYLASAEGLVIHWNRKESNYTSPYGVYKKSFPHAKVIKYIDSLFHKYKLNITRKNSKLINTYLTLIERTTIRELAYSFYVNEFMNQKVDSVLKNKRLKKTRLSYFSISVNGGVGRGNKALQTGLNVTVDGGIGNQTLSVLNAFNGKDNLLNVKLLNYMKDFYDYLIRRNFNKYGINKNGWYNRLRKLGLKI